FQAEDGIRDRNVTGVQTCALPICGHDYLVLDRGQTAETGLATATVVGPFDPGDDRDPEFLSGGPRASVQNVLLQQGEERFHGGVVSGCADPAHGSDHGVVVQCADEFSATKLTASVGVHDTAGHVPASGHGAVERCHRQPG